MLKHCAILALSLLVPASAGAADAAAKPLPTFKDGANCLFIGHSFFVPVARSFDKVAGQNGFASHRVRLVFAPGKRGLPADLWKSPRHKQQIEDALATGKVDLLGMAGFAGRNSSFDAYRRWIDLALQHNPNTRFFIGACWTPGGPRLQTGRFNKVIETSGERIFETVTELRKAYPKNHIYFVNYGKVAAEMKERFEAAELPDISKVSGRGRDVLFRDGLIGHGGPMMLDLSALVWLNTIYGADVDKLKYSAYKSDVKEIVGQVLQYNQKYQ